MPEDLTTEDVPEFAGQERQESPDNQLFCCLFEFAPHAILSAGRDGRTTTEHAPLMLAAIRDISNRMRAEAERHRLLAQLRLQIERMPLAYLLSGPDLRCTDWNPAAERTFGYAREDVLGKHTYDVIVAPQSRPLVEAIFERLRAGDMHAHGAWESVTKDERTITCQWHNTPLMDDDGTFQGVLSLAEDITEKRTLEEQYRRAQKMEAIGQLANGVAHDFNNLLTVINGNSELLLQKIPRSDPSYGLLEAIHSAGERSACLIRQLLAFSRRQSIVPQPFDLNAVVAPQPLDLNAIIVDIEKMLRRIVGEDIQLRMSLAPHLGTVKAEPGQIEQVILILAVNARDAMSRGGTLNIETANIEFDESDAKTSPDIRPGSYTLLAVSDTGWGMTAAVKARIFEPFFTTKEVGKGAGLGLAVVRGVMQQVGGRIEVYSEPGVGTTFKVYLPQTEVSAQSGRSHSLLIEAVCN
jgi:PAS domain S-box-containing protein